MTWVFIDDHTNESEQLCDAGGAAAWYHVCGHAFCRRKEPARRAAGERVDFIPATAAFGLFAPYTTAQARAHVAALVRVRLWLDVAGGYALADWSSIYDRGSSVPQAAAPSRQPSPPECQPTPSQLGGRARASQASRGPGGTFQRRPADSQPTASQNHQPAGQAAPATRASDPVPDPEPIKQKAAAKDLTAGAREESAAPAAAASEVASKQEPQRLPSNLEEALAWPICARADVALTHPERAEWLQPQKWPEVLAVATELHTAAGLGEVRLGSYGRDSGVRAIVELFGAGYMPGDLQRAVRTLPSEPWWGKDGAKRGLASLTPEVVRRALASGLSPAQEARVARAMGQRPPSALGEVLKAVGGGS